MKPVKVGTKHALVDCTHLFFKEDGEGNGSPKVPRRE
jgi:hypothetical protein